MADGDREGIGGMVGSWRLGETQKRPYHPRDLILSGAAGTADGALDLLGRVAGAGHAALTGGEHHDAAGLTDGEGAAGVGAEVELLKGDRVGVVLCQQLPHGLVDPCQPQLRADPSGGLDHAAVERHRAPAAVGDDSISGVGEARVYAEHDHRPVILRVRADACMHSGRPGRLGTPAPAAASLRRSVRWPAVSDERTDFAAEGLLDGLEGRQRSERLVLLQELAAEGVPLSELRRATQAGTILYLPADRVIGSRDRYTALQISEMTGLDLEYLTRLRRAMGLPIPEDEEAVYSESEIESLRQVPIARAAGLTDEEILDLMRVLGRGLSQVAEVMRAIPLKLVLQPGMSEPELAQSYAHAAEQLYPLVNPLVSNVLALHMRNATQSTVVSEIERSGGRLPGSRDVAVCFADLVGFTRLGEEVAPDELGRLAVRLEALAGDVAEPPVRLVKTIGDAAMLASTEPEALLGATLALLEAADAEGEEFPQLRAGAAFGAALPRAGDWFGRPVNLASRITAVARPGSLLVDEALHDAGGDSYRWSFAGERRLKGINGRVPLFRARPPAA
jgi:adenylate cyclase